MITEILTLLQKFIPDGEKKQEQLTSVALEVQKITQQEIKAQKAVLIAELQGESWLQRSWRPILMLVFASLLVLHWLGFTSDTITNDVVIELLNIVKVGLGGYVVGRSAEKIMKEYKK